MKTVTFQAVKWLSGVSVVALAACSSGGDDLDAWMETQKRNTPPTVEALTPPQKFNPQRYEVLELVEPFSNQKFVAAVKQGAAQPNSAVAAELNRRREPLEAYPLDNVSMVGSVVRKGQQFALLKVDNLLYQVKVGDYLGQNYGKIMKITETEIALREIVQDASGEWIERPAALQLQEGAQ
jgi:type IV pilus assembly protein PilP